MAHSYSYFDAPEEVEGDDITVLMPSTIPNPTVPVTSETPATHLVKQVLSLAQEVFAVLGPGHSEAVYQRALEAEFITAGLSYESYVHLPVVYKNKRVGFVELDLQLQDPVSRLTLIVELKSGGSVANSKHTLQCEKYQRLVPGSHLLLVVFGDRSVSSHHFASVQ